MLLSPPPPSVFVVADAGVTAAAAAAIPGFADAARFFLLIRTRQKICLFLVAQL